MFKAKAQELSELFATSCGEKLVPPLHVLHRLAAVIANEDVVLVDANFDGGEQVTGEALVISTSRVMLATMVDSRREPHHLANAENTVEVVAWSRKTLRGIAIRRDVRGNSDVAWEHDLSDVWPVGASVELRYLWRDDLLTLPLARYPLTVLCQRLSEQWESIVADLGVH
jgi:hypothetical protein